MSSNITDCSATSTRIEYSDRARHFAFTLKSGQPVDPSIETQIGRALRQLGIEMILSNSRKRVDVANNGLVPGARRTPAGVAPSRNRDDGNWPSYRDNADSARPSRIPNSGCGHRPRYALQTGCGEYGGRLPHPAGSSELRIRHPAGHAEAQFQSQDPNHRTG
jgi:hypothetical protein